MKLPFFLFGKTIWKLEQQTFFVKQKYLHLIVVMC